jgi:hypothetical protein
MTWDDYQAIRETLEILGDDNSFEQLRCRHQRAEIGKDDPLGGS